MPAYGSTNLSNVGFDTEMASAVSNCIEFHATWPYESEGDSGLTNIQSPADDNPCTLVIFRR